MAERWDEITASLGWFNPNLAKALEHGRAAGMDPDEISGVYFPNREEAYVTFYREAADELRSFDARGERSCHT